MGIMLVYDVTNEKSFDNIKNWIRNIEEHASSDVEKMILGNKCDIQERRQVSRERGEQLAIEYNIKFMETSAKSSLNVEEAFFKLAKDIKTKMEKKLVSVIQLQQGQLTTFLFQHRSLRIKPEEVITWERTNLLKSSQRCGSALYCR